MRSLAALLLLLGGTAAAQGLDPSCARDFDSAAPPLIDAQPAVAADAASRVRGRSFPSVFQAWRPVEGADLATSLSRHDLAWIGPYPAVKGNSRWPGLTTRYDATAPASSLRSANPNLVLLMEVRWRDAWKDYLPDGHPWWGRDGGDDAPSSLAASNNDAQRPMYFLKHGDACLQRQVARQCKAAVASGVFDGCMLDWWAHADSAQVEMLRKVREAIGPEALIIVNANGAIPKESMPYINGVFAEGFGAWGRWGQSQVPFPDKAMWDHLVGNLKALRSVREPRINAIEAWGDASDKRYIRGFTAAVLAYSDAYLLFSRPNGGGRDHTHYWEEFWDKGLGRPMSDSDPAWFGNGALRREFTNGTVVWNRSDHPVTITFPEQRTSRAANIAGRAFTVPAGDGDIFLK